MEKKEFLAHLREYLSGEVSVPIIESNIKYYDGYISERCKTLEEEKSCIEEIGDPRLIATTIITSSQMQNGAQYSQETRYDETYEEEPKEESFNKSLLQMIPLKYKIIGVLSSFIILLLLFFIARALLPVFLIILLFIAINKIIHK